jgi:hypothetical protein
MLEVNRIALFIWTHKKIDCKGINTLRESQRSVNVPIALRASEKTADESYLGYE